MASTSNHIPFDSISRKIFNPAPGLILKHKVSVGSRTSDKHRRPFMSEYIYGTDRYIDVSKVSSLQIATQDYLILETCQILDQNHQWNENFQPMRMMFDYTNIQTLQMALNTSFSWLSNPKDVCELDSAGNPTRIKSDFMNVYIKCISLFPQSTAGKMTFKPTIMTNKFTQTKQIGALLSMGPNDSQVATLDYDQCGAWVYFMDKFNLYEASLVLANQLLLSGPMVAKIRK